MSDYYVVGVDLGQARDPTAICVVRRPELKPPEIDSDYYHPRLAKLRPAPRYEVGYLRRVTIGTSYVSIVRQVEELMGKLPAGSELVIDQSGVGRAIFDLFKVRKLRPIGLTITAGNRETREGRMYSVPKLQLVSGVQALLHKGELKILRTLPDSAVLVRELQEFRVEYTASGHLTFNARSGAHDDLVLALAIGVWRLVNNRRLVIDDKLLECSRPARPLY